MQSLKPHPCNCRVCKELEEDEQILQKLKIGNPQTGQEDSQKSDGINPKDRVGMTKPPMSLVPPVAIVHCAMAMRNGAVKYGPYNWRSEKVQSMIYLDAALRHIADFIDGEECAKDSGVHHLAHAMACCAILLDAFEGGFVKDTRPKSGAAPAVIERMTEKK